MFCPKCGTQLPDGAMFCTSCGNQLNNQPTAPIMPVDPVAPVMDTPMMDAPVMEAPMMDAPIMPASEPAFNNAPYNPAGQYGYNNAPGFVPNNVPVNKPKKSKAPIFIGLGIGVLVIAIIAIVLVLVLTGDDKKKKKNEKETNKTTVKVESSTEEITTEEPTTEKPTVVVDEMDFDDAETVVTKFLNAIENANYSKASNYIYPPCIEYLESEGYSADMMSKTYNMQITDMSGNKIIGGNIRGFAAGTVNDPWQSYDIAAMFWNVD